jgi:glycosyltransferase involved in cell wall biosynthesis
MIGNKIQVLFMQSQTYFGADSQIHALMMRSFDRERVDVHAACSPTRPGQPSPAFQALEKIPDLHLLPTTFGTSIYTRSVSDILRSLLLESPAAVSSLVHLVGYLWRNHIDIIHCTEKPRDAFLGFLLSRITGAKCVIHLHVKAERWISPLVRWSMGRADALIGVSDFVRESILDMGYRPEKTFSVLNSLDLSRWNDALDGEGIRQEFGMAPDTPLVVVISRLFHWKGHTELLKALSRIKMVSPQVRLMVVGEDDPRGAPGRGSFLMELKKLVYELEMEPQVIFTGFRKDIPQILAACDIFAMPSFEEPFGMVYLEAMAMKKPIIALDNGGAREIVEHNKSGLLSPPYDINALADNLMCMIQEPAMRRRMGDYGRQHVERYFTAARMAGEVLDIYQHILGVTSNDARVIYHRAAAR